MSLDESTTAGTENEPILEADDVNVTFDMDRGLARVLNGVDITIHAEEVLGIVGESGCGKSMFASSLLDAVVEPGTVTGNVTYYPEEGDPVNVADLSSDELDDIRWNEIALVFQSVLESFNPTMKIGEHFRETIRAHGADYDERMEHARYVLDELSVNPDYAFDSYPQELSGGMKQRVLIALAMLLEPRVLVMDEPTGSLDLLMQRAIINLLKELQEEYDLTIVFITHDLSLVAGLVDRLGVMYAFDFVELGTTEQVIRGARHPYTRALLRSVPNLWTPPDEMAPIEGSPPDPVNVPTGCPYHPRCPLADVRCEHEEPELLADETDHSVACFYWERAEEEIDYEIGTEFVERLWGSER